MCATPHKHIYNVTNTLSTELHCLAVLEERNLMTAADVPSRESE